MPNHQDYCINHIRGQSSGVCCSCRPCSRLFLRTYICWSVECAESHDDTFIFKNTSLWPLSPSIEKQHFKQQSISAIIRHNPIYRSIQGQCFSLFVLNFNNKAQIKQQMSHLRVRPLEKPLIVQSLTYNHRPQQSDNSSEASFLKLSEKNSQELEAIAPTNIFRDMQERLNRLEVQSLIKIHQVQNQIKSHGSQKKRNEGRVTTDRGEAELTCRCVRREFQEEDLGGCNFQMDENRNYVRHSPLRPPSNLMRCFIEVQEVCSEPQGQPTTVQKAPTAKSIKCQSGRSSLRNLSQSSPAKQKQRCLKGSSINRRNCSLSAVKNSREGSSSIYKQILSNYSTAKLLAIQKASQ